MVSAFAVPQTGQVMTDCVSVMMPRRGRSPAAAEEGPCVRRRLPKWLAYAIL